jgi:L-fucose isomerase
VHHVAAPGEATFARLTRKDHRYRMQVVRGAIESYDEATTRELVAASTPEWPHAFTRLEANAQRFLSEFGANHIHAVPGDHLEELRAVCQLLDIDFVNLAALA